MTPCAQTLALGAAVARGIFARRAAFLAIGATLPMAETRATPLRYGSGEALFPSIA